MMNGPPASYSKMAIRRRRGGGRRKQAWNSCTYARKHGACMMVEQCDFLEAICQWHMKACVKGDLLMY